MRSDINENIEIIEKNTSIYLDRNAFSITNNKFIVNTYNSKYCKTNTGCDAQVKMVNSQIEAYALKHNRNPSNIDDLVSDGFIKEGQKTCKSGQTISIANGEAVAN